MQALERDHTADRGRLNRWLEAPLCLLIRSREMMTGEGAAISAAFLVDTAWVSTLLSLTHTTPTNMHGGGRGGSISTGFSLETECVLFLS